MSTKASFAEISPSELKQLYFDGMSIKEVAGIIGRSYTYTRNKLLSEGVTMRSKAFGTEVYLSHHPEWSRQFIKYEVANPTDVSDEKVLLLMLVATEGYNDSTSFGFTNTQEFLHDRFRELVYAVYGKVLIGRNRITSRISSIEIARNISSLIPSKTFHDSVLQIVLASPRLTAEVLRIVADTEGSMLISVRKAPRNYTVEYRIVLSSSNPDFTRQFVKLLSSLGIRSKPTSLGAVISRKAEIARFISVVGFSPQARVVRKRGKESIWYGFKKAGLAALFRRISEEQSSARSSSRRGCFADCFSRAQVVLRLKTWYAESNGGDES